MTTFMFPKMTKIDSVLLSREGPLIHILHCFLMNKTKKGFLDQRNNFKFTKYGKNVLIKQLV